MEKEKFHCYECGGFAKAKGETCNTCDGAGNPKPVLKVSRKSRKKAK